MKRKIIQIACRSEGPDSYPATYALCDDGTVWFRDAVNAEWTELPPIPQP